MTDAALLESGTGTPRTAARSAVVCHVIDHVERGGAQTRLLNDLGRMNRQRFRHVVVAGDGPAPLSSAFARAGIELVQMPRFGWCDLAAVRRLARLLRQQRVDIVHSQLFAADQVARTAGAWAGVRWLVSTAQSSVYEPEAGSLYSPWRRTVDRWTSHSRRVRVVAVSHYVKQSLVRRLGIAPERICVIPNHVDPSRFDAPDAGAAGRLRAALGGQPGDTVIIMVARLHEAKGHQTALEAMARMQRPATLWCVGDGPLRSVLERQALALGLRGRVAWLGEREDVPALLGASDVFLLPSRSEGLPLTLLEAMAARRACVASDIGPVREVLEGGEIGVRVPVADAGALAAALDRLAADAGLRQRLGEAARTRVETEFSSAANVARLERFYDGLMEEGGCTGA